MSEYPFVTAMVTADNHLGAYYARFRPDQLEARRLSLRRNFERVVDAAIERRVSLFLHAGDLFDRPDPRNVERAFVARQVRRLLNAGITICAIAGNHDRPRSLGYDSAALPHEEMEALGAIHLFRRTDALAPQEMMINGWRVAVSGMSSDFNRPDDVCPLEGCDLRQGRAGDIDLALLHYGVEGWAPPHAREPCLSLQNLDRLQMDAICVGHLHTPNQRRLPGGALLLNPGATEHINFGEEPLDCGFWELKMRPGHVDATYTTLPTQPMRTLELRIGPEDEGRKAGSPRTCFMERLTRAIEAVGKPDQLLRVRLHGRLDRRLFHELDLPALQKCGARGNFHCQLETDGLSVIDPLADLPIGFGVGFDLLKEMDAVTGAAIESFGDNPAEQEICRQAGEALHIAYDRFTGRTP